ncbi:MAG TPA: LuxR C-terminal-related transcriptional regulator, partial [Gemmatimonadaceae bacterium]
RGERAQASGWLSRAQRLLDDGPHDGPERGLLLALSARSHLQRGDLPAAQDAVDQATALAGRFDDPDLRVLAPMCRAQLYARAGDLASAAALFDELMVAVTIGEASPATVGIVYCAVIDNCQAMFDYGRAREWTFALSRWCEGHPDLVPFRGKCLVHRAEVMRLGGAWSEAIAVAEQACAWLKQLAAGEYPSAPSSSWPTFKYPVGAAYYELADLYRMRGNHSAAEESYRQASLHGYTPDPGLALLRALQGRHDAAVAAIRRALAQPQRRPERARTLVAAVEVFLSAGDHAAARSAAEDLADMAADNAPPFLRALVAHTRGMVLLAAGAVRDAVGPLRLAWMAWQDLDVPYEAARVRVLLAQACRALGDHEAADLELEAALRVFQRLGAEPDAAYIQSLRRSAVASVSPLTTRELQVMRLVAKGQSNRAIAEALAISERTVDRHVSNILRKLDVPSRSAATAHAINHGLV